MSAWYLYYQHFFADLKDIFAAYIKSGDHVFDIGCGNKPDGWRYFSMQDTPFFIFRKARNAKIEMAFKQCTSICCIM
jgi:hypothetical protein